MKKFSGALSVFLAALMVLSVCPLFPMAAPPAKAAPADETEEDVTLIVQLADEGAIAKDANGLSDGELSAAALREQSKIRKAQKKLETSLEKTVFGGEEVELLYTYSLLTNAIAITAKPSQIEKIAAVKGVDAVFEAPTFEAVPTDAQAHEAVYADNYFTGSENTTAYRGAGTVVAVVDTGLDTDHTAFFGDVPEAKISFSDVESLYTQTHACELMKNAADPASLYRTQKVPFGFNYADASYDITHKNDTQTDHGTHVSGIAVGSEVNDEGEILFEGVAPDAQLMVMKVYGKKRSGNYADILAAVEDAVLLGADVINLSLGSCAGFTYAGDDPDLDAGFVNAAESGVIVCVSAGNNYTAAYHTLYGNNHALASNPDNGVIGSPASFDDNLAVAAMTSNAYRIQRVDIAGRTLAYTCSGTDEARRIEKYIGQPLEYTVLKDDSGEMCIGTPTEFEAWGEACGVGGRFVLVRRGQAFVTTVAVAEENGAIGVIVCNNVDGALSSMKENTEASIPAIFISREDGDYLLSMDGTNNEMAVYDDMLTVDNPAAGTMADFSSWGVTPDLKLKPEITGYGGNVYSCVDNNSYGLKSGTSMSAPYLAGVSALVKERINTGDTDPAAENPKRLAAAFMMSTARPVTEKTTGKPYSPRKQGAGLVQIDAALSTKAYITVESSPVPKIDLGDDPAKTGVYTLPFHVVNFGDRDLTFVLSATAQTEKVEIKNVSYLTRRVDPEKAAAFLAEGKEFDEETNAELVYAADELENVKFMSGLPYDLGENAAIETGLQNDTLVVPAGGEAAVSLRLTLRDGAKAYMDENFANGIYIEGFIKLAAQDEGQPDLGAPYMGFYGDWTQAPVFDEGSWEDEYAGEEVHPQMSVSAGGAAKAGAANGKMKNPLGAWIPGETAKDPFTFYKLGVSYVRETRNIFGPDGDHKRGTVYAEMGQLRGAKRMEYTVTDADTGAVYASKSIGYVRKTFYHIKSAVLYNSGYYKDKRFQWDGTDQNTGAPVPAGTRVKYEVRAYLDYGAEETQNNLKNVFSFIAYYDSGAPDVEGLALTRDAQTGNVMLRADVRDDTVLDALVFTVSGTNAAGEPQTAISKSRPYPERAGDIYSETLDLTALAAQNGMTAVRSVRVEAADLFGRSAATPEGEPYEIRFAERIACAPPEGESLLRVGGEWRLRYDFICENGGADNSRFGVAEPLIYGSDDPEIASVDESGLVRGVRAGYTVIRVKSELGGGEGSLRVRVVNTALQQLIDAAPAWGTVKWTGGDTEESVVIGKDLTLDLGSATLTGVDGYPAVTVTNGNVTLRGGTVSSHYREDAGQQLEEAVRTDAVGTVCVTGGNVLLDALRVDGTAAQVDDQNVLAGSAVKLGENAALTVKDSALKGLYAVNNSGDGSKVTLVSGHFEGLSGALADPDAAETELDERSDAVAITPAHEQQTDALSAENLLVVRQPTWTPSLVAEDGALRVSASVSGLSGEHYIWEPALAALSGQTQPGEETAASVPFAIDENGKTSAQYAVGKQGGTYTVSFGFALCLKAAAGDELHLISEHEAAAFAAAFPDLAESLSGRTGLYGVSLPEEGLDTGVRTSLQASITVQPASEPTTEPEPTTDPTQDPGQTDGSSHASGGFFGRIRDFFRRIIEFFRRIFKIQ